MLMMIVIVFDLALVWGCPMKLDHEFEFLFTVKFSLKFLLQTFDVFKILINTFVP